MVFGPRIVLDICRAPGAGATAAANSVALVTLYREQGLSNGMTTE